MPHFGKLRRAGAALLEEGVLGGPFSRLIGGAWARRSAVLSRTLDIPAGITSVGVGGSTLGGSYRTPMAITLARRLAASGARAQHVGPRVGFVSHGYGSKLRVARAVRADDRAEEVGDEALLAARLLGPQVLVTVGPTRQSAIDCAVQAGARALVFDGLLQSRPQRLTFSVLALDAEEPWGSGEVPPLGDLRAEPSALIAHADAVVMVAHEGVRAAQTVACAHRAVLRITGARNLTSGERKPVSWFADARVGLSTAIGRPDRVRRALAAHGVEPDMIVASADHAPPSFPLAPVDAWLVTEKCATWLDGQGRSHLAGQAGAPNRVFVLETELTAPSLGAFAEAAVLDRTLSAP